MTTPTLPAWWPPSGYEEISEAQVRGLFAYLRTVVPPVMADARRRIQARVGHRMGISLPLPPRCAL